MSKICIYTDNHFSTNSSIIRSNGVEYSTRLENQIKSINWVEQLAVEKCCEKIIHLGDFFDKPDLSSQELSALKEIKWSNLPHKFICGNHEMGSNDLKYNSLNALSKVGDVIDRPTIIGDYECEILLLPYILETNRKSLSEYKEQAIKEYQSNELSAQEVKNFIILSHNDIAGLQYGQFLSKVGFNIDEIENNCDLFINGHLHNQTQVTDNILNLGNLTGQNFSEDGFKYSHCAAILDTDTLSVELIDNPYAFNFYKIDAIDYEDLKSQVNKLKSEKEYSIATIKINEKDVTITKNYCKEYFKEFKVISFRDTILTDNSKDVDDLVKVDHIQEFNKCCFENIGDSDILREELSLL